MTAYRIEDLARESGSTVRTIRAYQDRGLLPKPERSGRANLYGPDHLARLRQIADLLERGYTLASIKELLEAWDAGTGLDGVLGLVREMKRPWSSEHPIRIGRAALTEMFGGRDDEAVAEAVALGVLEPVGPEDGGGYLVPSPQELAVAAELHAAGVPLAAVSGHLRELRGQVEHMAERFMAFTVEHVFHRFLDHPLSDEEATEAAEVVRRLRPLAEQTVNAELVRAMHTLTSRMVQCLPEPAGAPLVDAAGPAGRLASAAPAAPGRLGVILPADTVEAVRALVGDADTAAFVAAAAEREVRARTMDALVARGPAGPRDAPGRRGDGGGATD